MYQARYNVAGVWNILKNRSFECSMEYDGHKAEVSHGQQHNIARTHNSARSPTVHTQSAVPPTVHIQSTPVYPIQRQRFSFSQPLPTHPMGWHPLKRVYPDQG